MRRLRLLLRRARREHRRTSAGRQLDPGLRLGHARLCLRRPRRSNRTSSAPAASCSVQVERGCAQRRDNVAPVAARLIPNVGELALEAQDGDPAAPQPGALFAGLARRPRAGGRSQRQADQNEAASTSRSPRTASAASARPASSRIHVQLLRTRRVGEFVEPNLASAEPKTTVELRPEESRRGKPKNRSPTPNRACSAPTTRARRGHDQRRGALLLADR